MPLPSRSLAVVGFLFLAASCGDEKGAPGERRLLTHVESNRVGSDADQWIEVRSVVSGEWDKVGLIFGYQGDREECLKAIEGLKRVNTAREYRCSPAN